MSKVYRYESGARLVYEKNKINKITSIIIEFKCGSRCDGDIPGLAHFTEHMFFTGTKDKNKQEISKEYFDFVGVNAYTNTRNIKFSGDVFTNELGDYLNLVAKLINESTFSQKNVDSEKKVVIQEIVEDSDKNKNRAIREFAYQMYKEDYLREGVLGNKKSIESIKSKDVKDFVKKYFVANNCDIFVVSTLPFAKIKKMIATNLLSKLKQNSNLNLPDYNDSVVLDKWLITSKKVNLDKNFLHVGFKLNFGFNDIDKLSSASMLCGVMSNMTDGLLKELRLEKGLVYSGGFYIDVNKNCTALVFRTELSKENIKETLNVLAKYLKNLKENGIDISLIEQERRETLYGEETSIASPRNVCYDLTSIKDFGKVVTMHEINMRRLKVTKNEIDTLAKEALGATNAICAIYGDADKTDLVSLKEFKDLFTF